MAFEYGYQGGASLLLAIGAFIGGCASNYPLPPQTIALRSTLDAAKARGLIAAALEPDKSGRGAHSKGLDAIVGARVLEDSIEYDLAGPQVLRGEPAPEGCVLWPEGPVFGDGSLSFDPSTRVASRCSERVTLAKISRIGLTEESGLAGPSYLVFVKESIGRNLIIDVGPAELNGLLAGLTFFSPGAALTSSGF
jgi:hypothetical protein